MRVFDRRARSREWIATNADRERAIAAIPANPSGGPFDLRGAWPRRTGQDGPEWQWRSRNGITRPRVDWGRP